MSGHIPRMAHERTMTTMRWTRRAAPCVIACVTVLAACGGGGAGQSAHDTPAASGRRIHGQVAKGPLRAAHVRLYAMDGKGERASDTPVAQTVTADDGSWSVDLDDAAGALLVESSGGSYVDESDPEPDVTRKRTVTLGNDEGLRAVLPAAAARAGVTGYSDAPKLRARRGPVGRECAPVL